ncbi:MAG: potassium channel family protein [Gaiellaceae bacterium]
MESQASRAEPEERRAFGRLARQPGERWTRFATRIANAYGVVLLLVVAIYVLASLVAFRGWGAVALTAVTAACTTVALVSSDARAPLPRSSAILGGGAVALALVSALGGGGSRLLGIAVLIQVVLLAVAGGEILGTVLLEQEVGFRTILGAISVYVLLGILFTWVYVAVDKLQAGSFFGVPTQTGDFVFFSITTLSTTGYGNLVPAAQPGRMLAGLEMLVGQIFLVTLIAGLVSLWRPGLARRP